MASFHYDTGAVTGLPTGSAGANSYIYIRYASDNSGTGLASVPTNSLDFIGIHTTTTALSVADSNDPATYTWVQYQGSDGTNGTDGTQILSGSGAPTSGVGVNGDWYIDTTNEVLYGPKAAGAWPGSGINLGGSGGIETTFSVVVNVAGLAGISGPITDDMAFVQSIESLYKYDGAAWVRQSGNGWTTNPTGSYTFVSGSGTKGTDSFRYKIVGDNIYWWYSSGTLQIGAGTTRVEIDLSATMGGETPNQNQVYWTKYADVSATTDRDCYYYVSTGQKLVIGVDNAGGGGAFTASIDNNVNISGVFERQV
jgi:hypothetical protein